MPSLHLAIVFVIGNLLLAPSHCLNQRTIQEQKLRVEDGALMSAEFEVDVAMYDDVSKHLASGCKFTMDELIMVSCNDGWFVLDQFKNFLKTKESKVRGS